MRLRPAADVSAVLRLDARVVGQTRWAPSSQMSWDQTFCLQLERVREVGRACPVTTQKRCGEKEKKQRPDGKVESAEKEQPFL